MLRVKPCLEGNLVDKPACLALGASHAAAYPATSLALMTITGAWHPQTQTSELHMPHRQHVCRDWHRRPMGTALQIWRLCWKGQSMLQPGELSPLATPSAQVLTADPVQTLQAAGCRQQWTLPLGQISCRGMLGAKANKCTRCLKLSLSVADQATLFLCNHPCHRTRYSTGGC